MTTAEREAKTVVMVSVVIPVRNEERFIERTLSALLRQDYPPEAMELLVCDGFSTDRTRAIVLEIAARDARVRLIDNPGIRSSAGRNAGFRAARGEYVLVIDGHVLIESDQLIRSVAELFTSTGAACLGRPQPPAPTEPGSWAETIARARASSFGHSGSSFIYSVYEGPAPAASMGAAYHRSVFDRVGYVDETFDACEDLEFNTRLDEAGLLCVTSPRLTVRYFVRDSPKALFRQMRRYGFGRFKYLLRHPRQVSLGQLAPPALVLALVVLPPLGFVHLALGAFGALAWMTYLGGITIATAGLVREHGTRRMWRYPVVFAAIHLGVGMGFLHSMLRWGRVPRPKIEPR